MNHSCSACLLNGFLLVLRSASPGLTGSISVLHWAHFCVNYKIQYQHHQLPHDLKQQIQAHATSFPFKGKWVQGDFFHLEIHVSLSPFIWRQLIKGHGTNSYHCKLPLSERIKCKKNQLLFQGKLWQKITRNCLLQCTKTKHDTLKHCMLRATRLHQKYLHLLIWNSVVIWVPFLYAWSNLS